jgi:hypothetical protein
MFDPITLALIGAGTGALIDRKKPLRGAVIGGTLGYGGGTAFGAGGKGLLGSTTAPTSAGAFEASMGLDKAYNAGSLAGLPGSGTIESVMGTANAAGTYTNPDYYANLFGNQIYTGNEGLLSQIGTGAGSIFDTVKTDLGEYATPQNLLGVSMLLNNMNQAQPMPSMSGGGAQGGTPPKFEPFKTGQVYTRKRRGEA